jgi:tetratricopeptide (TPR) repeat protein
LRRVWITGAFLLQVLVMRPAGAQRYAIPPDYPHSLKRDFEVLRASGAHSSSDPGLLVQLAEVYRHLGDDLLEDPEEQRAAYEEGARIAQRALELEETNAEAHFLYAANIGSAARIQGLFRAMGTLEKIKAHLTRAIELQPDHAPSLGFMGGLLADLPAFLGGDEMASRRYLERAVAADGNYTIARIVLARILIRQNQVEAARQQLRAVVEAEHPRYPYTWKRKLRPEAEELLRVLEDGSWGSQ